MTEKRDDIQNSAYEVIQPLLQTYNIEIDLVQLLKETHQKDFTLKILIEETLESLGFKVAIKSVNDHNLLNEEKPYIIASQDCNRFFVFSDQSHEITLNTIDDISKTSEQLKSYTGYLLKVIDKPDNVLSKHTEHMKTKYEIDWFWVPIINFRKSYYEIIAVSIFINLFALSIPLFSLNVYDRVVLNFAQETLIVLTIGIFIALLFDFLFKTIRFYILERLAEKLGNDYDRKLMDRLVKIKDSSFQLSIGAQANFFRELQSIREFYASKLVPTLVDIPFILLFLGIIFLLSPALSLIPLIASVLILIINFFTHIPLGRITEDYFSATQKKTSFLIETLSGIETLKTFNAFNNRLFHWSNNTQRSSHNIRRNNFIVGSMSNFTFTMSQVCHVLIIFFGVYEIQEGQLTIGGLIACTILSSRVIAPIMNLSSLMARLKQSKDILVSIDHIFRYDYLDYTKHLKASKMPISGNVSLKNITFQYPDQKRNAVDGANINITHGEHIGIIGPSAAGKTTLAKIINASLKADDGEVFVGDYNIDVISTADLSKTIAYAPQDPFFFKGSILYNITLGREGITPEQVENAVKVSGLAYVLKQNGQGLDMDVGEQGVFLSGGQKQALSLARALVSDPAILIFDEPTTGMDNMLEKHIQILLSEYIKDKTFIMITHRTSLLSLIDRLVMIDNGKIIADGPKEKILSQLQK